MSLEIVMFSDLPPVRQMEVALQVSDYTNGRMGEQPLMLPVSPDEVLAKYSGAVALQDNVNAGFIGALVPEGWQGKAMSEMGTLVTFPEFRKQGVAHALVDTLAKDLASATIRPYALCNKFSLSIFQNNGFSIEPVDAIPANALTLCATCPSKPPEGCCDTVVVWNQPL